MMQQLFQEIDYRLARLRATQREEWRLQQQYTDEDRRRTLTEAALEALKYAQLRTKA
jgi:hypothetical protein